jgi:hypothetical protein
MRASSVIFCSWYLSILASKAFVPLDEIMKLRKQLSESIRSGGIPA